MQSLLKCGGLAALLLSCAAAHLPTHADEALAGLDAAQRRAVQKFLAKQRDPEEPRARPWVEQARPVDLDADGRPEILLLWSKPYGNSLSTSLSLLAPAPQGTGRPGWRLAGSQRVRGINPVLTLAPPLVRIDSAVEKPGDPRCCPSGKITQQLRLSAGRLQEMALSSP
ncbi:hypothetical protein [Roseateles cavernae]|uniref:hypothetical protein n=1 Tax=Roseateles cavernae TaxID=3153578 RepID=UPI0032E46D6A